MQVYPNQLSAQLNKSLPNQILLFGEEPQQKLEALQKIRDTAQQQGFTERHSLVADNQFEWQNLVDAYQSMSLFAERQLIELEIPTGKPGTEGAKTLLEISAKDNPDIVLVVHGGKIGKDVQNTKWFKALDKQGIYVPCFVLEGNRLAQWISGKLSENGINNTPELVGFFCDFFEGNLIAAVQEMEKLKLLFPDGNVSRQDISGMVSEQSRYNVFQLTDAILAGDAQRSIKLLGRLESEGIEPVVICWALVREWQVLDALSSAMALSHPTDRVFSQHRIWKNKQSAYLNLLRRLDQQQLMEIRDKLSAFDVAVKSSAIKRPYVELCHLCLLFMPMALTNLQMDYA
ncbi:DNA polymerase III subunit delta [Planctobacterium marinum]|uniref:DNA polymerase III subunit delta n=1 Tax=Planctobacterium marinum TaxID=1631968 RepID=A0AA48HHZ7_9ALTE|nr:DNA polymerase III subunit delta [Planctobacterium marinum]